MKDRFQAFAFKVQLVPLHFGGGFGGGMAPNPQQQQQTLQQRQQAQLLTDALDAVVTHARLMALLRAEMPKGLLAAVPPGYMAQRVVELAEGTCMANFSYAGGGDWGGKPWTQELPDDSQLLCYLFCSFLVGLLNGCRIQLTQIA